MNSDRHILILTLIQRGYVWKWWSLSWNPYSMYFWSTIWTLMHEVVFTAMNCWYQANELVIRDMKYHSQVWSHAKSRHHEWFHDSHSVTQFSWVLPQLLFFILNHSSLRSPMFMLKLKFGVQCYIFSCLPVQLYLGEIVWSCAAQINGRRSNKQVDFKFPLETRE